MRYGKMICCLLLLLCGCKHSDKEVMQALKETGMLQDKEDNGFHYRLQYMPPKKEREKDLLRFRLRINASNGENMKGTDQPIFSYGVDSLFGLINVTDTLKPVDVVRVANGNIGGVEYMLLFNRPIAFSHVNVQLLFRDFLFIHKFMNFPLKGAAIKHIDSLSLNI